MITNESINKVRDEADIQVVVGSYITIKKKGANFTGSCPFHEEKSPSFMVSVSKNIYKCFGCGAGGDPIKFVIEHEKVDFIAAVRIVADLHGITLEETEETAEDKEQVEKRVQLLAINKQVAEKYFKTLDQLLIGHPVKQEILKNRQLTMETINEFQIGFAPEEWKYISRDLIERGMFEPAKELGLVATSNDRNFDNFRNRIIFPIHNERGQVVGFGGRIFGENSEKAPKYINSKESVIYKKEKVLFGLYQAQRHIRKCGFAILVEGYYDVTSMHQSGAKNTIAPCGTALTETQIKLLKRFTDHVVLMGDGDDSGMEANLKAVDLLLKYNIRAEICTLPKPETPGEKIDPDIFARQHPMPIEQLIDQLPETN